MHFQIDWLINSSCELFFLPPKRRNEYKQPTKPETIIPNRKTYDVCLVRKKKKPNETIGYIELHLQEEATHTRNPSLFVSVQTIRKSLQTVTCSLLCSIQHKLHQQFSLVSMCLIFYLRALSSKELPTIDVYVLGIVFWYGTHAQCLWFSMQIHTIDANRTTRSKQTRAKKSNANETKRVEQGR